eukprot:gnl/TRDRNA2_/TRDRNA2_183264_c0_seq1.p1 gnl/TRDRNA2_/TRDRNA2_183264_c0~~gnl/TRDRNA2_/TRDRNA2_183264_c0_seq1.p1  ORF type:complete len:492 (+),score=106.99 gnl/TRDRNA2_/TRDRNA2_183264_c0_seq1:188-1477(+)
MRRARSQKRSDGKVKTAWGQDPEMGMLEGKASHKQEWREAIQRILEEELARSLQRAGISERLVRLEKQGLDLEAGLAMKSAAKEDAPGHIRCDDFLATASTAMPDDLMATHRTASTDSIRDVQANVSLKDATTNTDAVICPDDSDPDDSSLPRRIDSGINGTRKDLTFGPSNRQRRYPDPPEKECMIIDEESALRSSFTTVQMNLRKREVQVQDLHRQLKSCREAHWEEAQKARAAAKRLRDLVASPEGASAVQAEEMQKLMQEVKDLSSSLADARQQEMQWERIAKRQRAFFMQNEHTSGQGSNVLKKHPAGEVFIAPPPVVHPDDDVNALQRQGDVGTSHLNPYLIDSWPVTPNASAGPAAAEPNLACLDEDDLEDMASSESDPSQSEYDFEDDSGADSGHRGPARLPPLPLGLGAHALSQESARSL